MLVRPRRSGSTPTYFLGAGERTLNVFRVVVIAAVAFGAVIALEAVWAIADVAMGLMALVNLTAILLLGKCAFGALQDYRQLRKQGREPTFVAAGNTMLPAELSSEVW